MILVNLSDYLSPSGLAPVCDDCCELLIEFFSYCLLFCADFRAELDRLIGGGISEPAGQGSYQSPETLQIGII